ncbi:PQQ-binding-like beta-propeller repeat protein [Candidatus Poribacteria bacterium]|nr:PQQ-binding-like beta-propeller repeat protein [Candidatus Poribacteria bacterium]
MKHRNYVIFIASVFVLILSLSSSLMANSISDPDFYRSAARYMIQGVNKGYCLIIGSGNGYLARGLAEISNLKIVGIEDDAELVDKSRKYLDKAGLYGTRVSIHYGSLEKLPYTHYFADLVVSENALTKGKITCSADEVFRLTKPFGGIAILGQFKHADEDKMELSYLKEWIDKSSYEDWKILEENGRWAFLRRGYLPGSGEWTHQYADARNSACSGDELVKNPMRVQWFGKPGPRAMVDRHHRALAPLWKDGKLFVPAAGENKIIAVDSYNGTELWETKVPNYRRLGANRDSGNMAVDDYLYVAAEDKCWGLDINSGKQKRKFKTPQLLPEKHDWGYVACSDGLLFGSGQKKGASRDTQHIDTVNQVYYDNRPVVTSDYLFCFDNYTGEKQWQYKNGVIINPAIAVDNENIYFVESRNPHAVSDDGRIKLELLLKKGYGWIVAIDKQTGKLAWENQVDLPFQHIIHLSCSDDIVIVLGTHNMEGHVQYDLYGFKSADGGIEWQTDYKPGAGTGGGHGEQDQHPVIVDNTLYMLESSSYNILTGEKGDYVLRRGGHGCGTLSGAASYLFARGSNPRMYAITETEEKGIPLDNVNRPGCWINIIPAGGLVLIPEFSSGCTCSYPIQTSIAFIPVSE